MRPFTLSHYEGSGPQICDLARLHPPVMGGDCDGRIIGSPVCHVEKQDVGFARPAGNSSGLGRNRGTGSSTRSSSATSSTFAWDLTATPGPEWLPHPFAAGTGTTRPDTSTPPGSPKFEDNRKRATAAEPEKEQGRHRHLPRPPPDPNHLCRHQRPCKAEVRTRRHDHDLGLCCFQAMVPITQGTIREVRSGSRIFRRQPRRSDREAKPGSHRQSGSGCLPSRSHQRKRGPYECGAPPSSA